jgi:hypothetical protein
LASREERSAGREVVRSVSTALGSFMIEAVGAAANASLLGVNAPSPTARPTVLVRTGFVAS